MRVLVFDNEPYVSKFKTTCCDFSKRQLEHYCEEHGHNCPDAVLKLSPAWEQVPERFVLLAANASYEAIFCPACGKNLKETCIPDRETENDI